jgi:anti-anti-sigma factor
MPGLVVPRLSVRVLGDARLPARRELYLAGELDSDTASALRGYLAAVVAQCDGGSLVLNLAGITFCDSAGLYTLVGVRQSAPVVGVDVSFAQVSAAVVAAASRAGRAAHAALRDWL